MNKLNADDISFDGDNVLEGKRMEDFPDNKVHQRFILR